VSNYILSPRPRPAVYKFSLARSLCIGSAGHEYGVPYRALREQAHLPHRFGTLPIFALHIQISRLRALPTPSIPRNLLAQKVGRRNQGKEKGRRDARRRKFHVHGRGAA
jgi:hypothetical protein